MLIEKVLGKADKGATEAQRVDIKNYKSFFYVKVPARILVIYTKYYRSH